jgi:hypothetical protein
MKGRTKPLKVMIHRLIEWLESKGFTSAEIVECVRYISGK